LSTWSPSIERGNYRFPCQLMLGATKYWGSAV
jgi:hypothetical protein